MLTGPVVECDYLLTSAASVADARANATKTFRSLPNRRSILPLMFQRDPRFRECSRKLPQPAFALRFHGSFDFSQSALVR